MSEKIHLRTVIHHDINITSHVAQPSIIEQYLVCHGGFVAVEYAGVVQHHFVCCQSQ